jgi:hypothetical protein
MLVATAARLMRLALDEAIARGVPREAAQAFIAGHAQIATAICFGAESAPFSDAAQKDMTPMFSLRLSVSCSTARRPSDGDDGDAPV